MAKFLLGETEHRQQRRFFSGITSDRFLEFLVGFR